VKGMQQIRTEEQKDLILNHISLVKNIASSLIDAANKFDPLRQSKFSNYAKFRIRGAIMDELRSMDFVSRSVRNRAKEVEHTILSLEQKFGRAVFDEEVAKELNMGMDHYHKVKNQMYSSTLVHIEDIDEMMGNTDDGYSFIDLLSDDSDKRMFEDISNHEVRNIIMQAMEDLPEKQRKVLMLYYWDDYTMKEVGQILGLAESTVSTHHNDALDKLRQSLKNRQTTLMFCLNN
jgi:RNA polymerase sigma factor for flagellar operon FliA